MKIQTFDTYIRYDLFIDKDGNVYRKSQYVTEYNQRTDTVIETRIEPIPVPNGFTEVWGDLQPKIEYRIYYRQRFDVPRSFGWSNEQIYDEAERQYKEGLKNNE